MFEEDQRKTYDKLFGEGYSIDSVQHHILECMSALCLIKRKLSMASHSKMFNSTEKFFAAAITTILNEIRYNKEDQLWKKKDRKIIEVFANNVKCTSEYGWLPLHWSIICGDKVNENDIKTIYA